MQMPPWFAASDLPLYTVTERQQYAISLIEDNLGIQFRGHSLEQASEFIGKYMEQSKAARRKKVQESRAITFKPKSEEFLRDSVDWYLSDSYYQL